MSSVKEETLKFESEGWLFMCLFLVQQLSNNFITVYTLVKEFMIALYRVADCVDDNTLTSGVKQLVYVTVYG